MKPQPWLLFMPDGTYDGLAWSPDNIVSAIEAHR